MKQFIPLAVIAVGILVSTGCATKNYVKKQVDPVSGKLDQVATKTDQQGQTLDQTRQTLDQTRQTQEKDETQLSATNERAMTADNRAGQALDSASQANQSANQANQKADKLSGDVNELRGVISNLDDYKQVAQTTVNFAFNSDKLTNDSKQTLDQAVANQGKYKRFFIAVEGFTDQVGTSEYNDALSRRRADAVVEYLVATHDIPIYRIHMIGLGKQKLLDDAKTREARAKNRRVEVTLYSADQSVAFSREGGPQANNQR